MLLCEFEDEQTDEGTSCTSSLSTSVSNSYFEDADELHLGAEAISFIGYANRDHVVSCVDANDSRRCSTVPSFYAMKELWNSLESEVSTRTQYAPISNVADLLKAREGDASEILAGLGFINNSQPKYIRDVLSRFDPSPLLTTEDNQHLEDICHPRGRRGSSIITCENEDCKSAAQERIFLPLQDSPGSGDSTKVLGSLEQNKKPHSKPMKSRVKFTKSRQSSFDLLPLVKEEDTSVEAFSEELRTRIDKTSSSSLMRQKAVDRGAALEVRKHQDHLSRLDEFTNDFSNVSSLNHVNLNDVSYATPVPVAFVKNRNLECPQLVNTRVESFELEEINSTYGDAAEGKRIFDPSESAIDGSLFAPAISSGDPWSPAVDLDGCESETSSGFNDDDTMNTTSPVHSSGKSDHLVGEARRLSADLCQKTIGDVCGLDGLGKSSSLLKMHAMTNSNNNNNNNNNNVKEKDLFEVNTDLGWSRYIDLRISTSQACTLEATPPLQSTSTDHLIQRHEAGEAEPRRTTSLLTDRRPVALERAPDDFTTTEVGSFLDLSNIDAQQADENRRSESNGHSERSQPSSNTFSSCSFEYSANGSNLKNSLAHADSNASSSFSTTASRCRSERSYFCTSVEPPRASGVLTFQCPTAATHCHLPYLS